MFPNLGWFTTMTFPLSHLNSHLASPLTKAIDMGIDKCIFHEDVKVASVAPLGKDDNNIN